MFQVGVNDNGEIQELSACMYHDVGATVNEKAVVFLMLHHLSFLYDTSTWNTKVFSVRTDTPSNSWVRGPGKLQKVTW